MLPAPSWDPKLASCPAITLPHPERRKYTPKELANITISLHPKALLHHKQRLATMAEGLKKHGLSFSFQPTNSYIDSDVAILPGFRQAKLHRYRHTKGLHTLFIESGFFQPRRKWLSILWEGITNCGNIVIPDDGGARFEKYFAHHLEPWKSDKSGYILLLGQRPGDKSLYGLQMNPWLHTTSQALIAHNKPIVFRPHPTVAKDYHLKNHATLLPPGTTLSTHKSLEKDLEGAAFAVTYSSTAAVESVMAGVPCVTRHQGSIASPVTSHDIMDPYFTPDRTKWCYETAWKQWSFEEIKNGDAWDVVKQYLLV